LWRKHCGMKHPKDLSVAQNKTQDRKCVVTERSAS
jgi:hypothetical protein